VPRSSSSRTGARRRPGDDAAAFTSLQALPASTAILDPAGKIVAVNETWKRFGRRNGLALAHDAVGADYLRYCAGEDAAARRFARELKALLAGKRDLLTLVYPCHSPHRQRWFSLVALPLSLQAPAGVALLHVDLTAMLPRARGTRGRPLHPPASLSAISGAVQRSVSDAVSAQLAAMLGGAERAAGGPGALVGRLSARQREVLRLLGEGKSNKEMARALTLSPNTVKLHVSAILQRLKLKSRTHAALLASRLARPEVLASNLAAWPKGDAA
jgi:DNA-binding CsgD family transcriptional regulator